MRFGLCAGSLEVLRQLAAWGYDYAEIGGATVLPFDTKRGANATLPGLPTPPVAPARTTSRHTPPAGV